MATLHFSALSSPLTPTTKNQTRLTKHQPSTLTSYTTLSSHRTLFLSTSLAPPSPSPSSSSSIVCSYKVVIEHEGETTELDVEEDETILSKAIDSGLSVPYDCQLGVCMTCPAKVLSGSVNQSEGMLSDDVVERGYALLCVAYPQSDCRIRTIPEDELLSLQLVTAND